MKMVEALKTPSQVEAYMALGLDLTSVPERALVSQVIAEAIGSDDLDLSPEFRERARAILALIEAGEEKQARASLKGLPKGYNEGCLANALRAFSQARAYPGRLRDTIDAAHLAFHHDKMGGGAAHLQW